MGIRINTNISAITAQRNLSTTQAGFATAVNRLSSGLRINMAADDAAGLSISEKLRSQSRGLRQAVRNAQDGVSLIQTAEGALSETSSILQRMRELAVQAKNATLSTEDADAVRLEVVELEAEIDRIADNTEFNGKTLLTGSFQQSTKSANTSDNIFTDRAAIIAVDGVYRAVSVTDPAISGSIYTVVELASGVLSMTGAITVAGILVTLSQKITASSLTVGETFTFNFNVFGITFGIQNVSANTLTATGVANSANGDSLTVLASAGASSNMVLQVGANANQVVTISLVDTRSASIGGAVSGFANLEVLVAALSGDMQGLADELISMVDLAILDINKARSNLGANQNRLGHTINNLTVGAENMIAAESRIRDADIALETVAFVKAQILQQAGVAVLAQANQAPQVVLALLR